MSYLADVKKQLRETFDQAFDFMWEDVQAALRSSYKNGYAAGQKDAKEGASTPEQSTAGPRRQWRRGARPTPVEGGES
jgi:hypothetical protein